MIDGIIQSDHLACASFFKKNTYFFFFLRPVLSQEALQ